MTTMIEESQAAQGFSVRAMYLGLVVLLVATMGVVGCDKDRTDAVRLYNEAMVAFDRGSPATAISLLEEALETDPTFYEAAYMIGQLQYYQLRNPEDAVDNFRRAVNQEPDNPQFNYRLASALAGSEEHEEAIEYFEEAIALESDDGRYWFEMAMSQEAIGEFTEAVESYMKAIELQPRLRMAEHDMGGEHYYRLGELYYRFRLYNEAIAVFENGAENNPASARLRHGKGLASMRLGRYDDAVVAFEEALERDPEHGGANFSLAEAYRGSGDMDAAIAQLETLLEEGGGSGLDRTRRQAANRLLDDLRAEKDEPE